MGTDQPFPSTDSAMRFDRFVRIISGLLAALGVVAVAACSDGSASKVANAAAASPTNPFVLALSWEPAFCETAPHVEECRTQTARSVDARQFSLHGLWPDGNYCGVDARTRETDEAHRWQQLPVIDLPKKLRDELVVAMPGTRSQLDRHEWIKHGTCAGTDQQGYYATALALTEAVNTSSLPALFMANMGKSLSAARIARAFDADFGAGTGERVTLECVSDGSRRLISGIRIALEGAIADSPDLSTLTRAAPPRKGGCKSGVVDPAGFQ